MKTKVMAEKLLLQWNLELVVYTFYPPMSSVSVIFCSIATGWLNMGIHSALQTMKCLWHAKHPIEYRSFIWQHVVNLVQQGAIDLKHSFNLITMHILWYCQSIQVIDHVIIYNHDASISLSVTYPLWSYLCTNMAACLQLGCQLPEEY